MPNIVQVSGLLSRDQVAQLLDHSVDELLLVTFVLAKLCEDVVFPTRVLHPAVGWRVTCCYFNAVGKTAANTKKD